MFSWALRRRGYAHPSSLLLYLANSYGTDLLSWALPRQTLTSKEGFLQHLPTEFTAPMSKPWDISGFLRKRTLTWKLQQKVVRLQKPWLGVLPLMFGLWLWLKPCPFFQKPLSIHTRSSGVYMSLRDREHWEPSGPDSPSPLHLDNSTGINLEMCYSPVFTVGVLYKI